MNTQTLAKAVKTFQAPKEYGSAYRFTIKAEAYQLGGNSHPHFSVTGEIGKPGARDCEACGCLHEEISKTWPSVRPIIALHSSNADDGEPLHAEANGYYWLAGIVGGLGEQYHGGSGSDGRTPDKCLAILADHLRITEAEAQAIADKVKTAFDAPYLNDEPTLRGNVKYAPTAQDKAKAATILARNTFHDYVNAQRDRWQAEAKAGIELIKTLQG